MRDLWLMRGAPGAGKSTWLKQNNLSQFALCADDLRLMFQSPIMDHKTGIFGISQKNDKRVWNLLFELLEARMERGEFTIIDATHSKTADFTKYYTLADKYRYRLYCIDFSDVPLETCKMQNKMRDQYKWVPDSVLENIYSRFETQQIPNRVTVVKPDDYLSILEYKPLDVNHYDKIVVFGDIHSCWNPLEKYFTENPFNPNVLYVFTGDYFDRGIQHREVCSWLLNHYFYPNVMLCQGNHEKWIMHYANNELDQIKSSEFLNNTMPALNEFEKKDLRQLCRKFIQCAYLKFDDKEFFINHAGIGFMPEYLKFIPSHELIRGGKYEDDIDKWFEQNNKNSNLIQIHGHRNSYNYSMNEFKNIINLNEYVEAGENLRILEITH